MKKSLVFRSIYSLLFTFLTSCDSYAESKDRLKWLNSLIDDFDSGVLYHYYGGEE